MEYEAIALMAFAAYLIGSLSPSYLLARYIRGVDIRTVGSRNAGTLNSYHLMGAWWALLVLGIDAGKGALVVVLTLYVVPLPDWVVFLTAPLSIVGHNWPFLLKFQGGKGAATLMGICLVFVPLASMVALIPGIAAVILSKNGIIGLTLGFLVFHVVLLASWLLQWNVLVLEPSWQQPALCLALTLLVAVSYGFAKRAQFANAIKQRSLRAVFYGS